MDAQQVIDDSQPMLDDVLGRIGIHRTGAPLKLRELCAPFSAWLGAQDISEQDRAFVTALVGAFICEYLIDQAAAVRHIENGRILLNLPVVAGVARQFDPYAAAMGLVTNGGSLEALVNAVAT